MNFKEAISKLKKSKEFVKFKKEHKDAYLCTAFFIIDFEGNQNTAQINFQFDDEKIGAFVIDGDIKLRIEDLLVKKKLDRIKEDTKIDIEDVVRIAKKQITREGVKSKASKIIAILGSEEKRQMWNVTCFFESFYLLNMHIDIASGKILKSEKKSLSDFFTKPADYVG